MTRPRATVTEAAQVRGGNVSVSAGAAHDDSGGAPNAQQLLIQQGRGDFALIDADREKASAQVGEVRSALEASASVHGGNAKWAHHAIYRKSPISCNGRARLGKL